jgi:hypothetical protein
MAEVIVIEPGRHERNIDVIYDAIGSCSEYSPGGIWWGSAAARKHGV